MAALNDRRIRSAYRLFPNNYIAADLLSGGSAYAAFYTAAEQRAFLDSMNRLDALCASGRVPYEALDELRDRYLHLYAGPVRA